MRARTASSIRLALLLALVRVLSTPVYGEEPVIEPIEIGFTETARRSLLFLDIEAIEQNGAPMVGLRKEDFKIRVNYTWRDIYSVDDLCPCGPQGASALSDAARAVLSAPPHFVLYLDFSQLGSTGRDQARWAAERWLREEMRGGDRVMLAGYSSGAGLLHLSEFTEDREQLLTVLDETFSDPTLVDPFPEGLWARLNQCGSGTVSCYNTGKREYRHARRGMEALRNFLTELDDVPARKTLLLFHQNASMFPGRLYGDGRPPTWGSNPWLLDFDPPPGRGRDAYLVPDLIELADEIGGTATASRTTLFPLSCGAAGNWTTNLGANLADFTGGDYNRQPGRLVGLLGRAGRRCACIYRIGLDAGDLSRSKVLRTKVKARGQTVPARYRIQYLTDADRWMRRAQLILSNPEESRDLGVRAATVPAAVDGSTWSVDVQVALDLSTVELLPSHLGHSGEWEVAALLARLDGPGTWEMLGTYRVRQSSDGPLRTTVLHERRIERLKPGNYELRAFVRDRATGLYGGVRSEIELPSAKRPGFAGPLLQAVDHRWVRPLPARKARRREPIDAARSDVGPLPVGQAPVTGGGRLRAVTWACPGDDGEIRSELRDDDAETPARLAERASSTLDAHGSCLRLVEEVDTMSLGEGNYVYRVSLRGSAASTDFVVDRSP